jgi:hypothetical protein
MRPLATLVASVFTMALLAATGHPAEVTKDLLGTVRISGTITTGDSARVQMLLASADKWKIEIDSPGGDVYEAMRLGRLLRAHRGSVEVIGPQRDDFPTSGGCASACVLVFAGAVTRRPGLWFDRQGNYGHSRLLIHRPYFQVAAPASAGAEWHTLASDVRAYLAEMNVPARLADMMMAIPPEEARELTLEERAEFFPPDDPAEDETSVAENAYMLGITSVEYRRRRQLADRCVQEPVHSQQAPEDKQVCSLVVTSGLSEAEVRRRVALGKTRCAELKTRDQKLACLASIWRPR